MATSNSLAARELAPFKRPTRSAILTGDCFFFSQLAVIIFRPSSIRDSNRAKIAFSFSKRSQLRQRINVSPSPSGDGQSLTSTPWRTCSHDLSSNSRSNFLSMLLGVPMM